MIGFLVIGAVGLGLLIVALLFGEVVDVFDVDIGGGFLSGPVIGSFLAAFGFGGALAMYSADLGVTGGALAGLGGGVVVGGIAGVATRSLMSMPTDETLRTGDLVGSTATVVTPIPEGGFGEVNVSHLGQTLKYNARAREAIEVGTSVKVITILSSSALMVARLEQGEDA